MTRLIPLLLALPLVLAAGCADMHGRGDGDDAGIPTDGSTCGGLASFQCTQFCGSDSFTNAMCDGSGWVCPPGHPVDARTCPPGCVGGAPAGGNCECQGTTWVCEPEECPSGLNPWSPDDPANACRVEGAECNAGTGSACGAGMWCTCESGRWSCAVAEPDPVCWCGREPEIGDPCNGSEPTCGQCCPTADGPNWPAMECVDGAWQPAACPEIVCPPVEESCPADTSAVRGDFCGIDGQSCGDPCCGSAIVCEDGIWRRGPDADCICEDPQPCGSGGCPAPQYCHQSCGPDDGIIDRCVPLLTDCASCECLEIESWERCEMVDGRPHVQPVGCG